MSDYMEASEEGWLSRIGNSIIGMLVGVVLFLVSFVVLFWNEGNYVRDLEASAELRDKTVEVKADSIDPANNGKPVFLTGKAVVQKRLSDYDFGIAGPYVRLVRSVEMYQWVQDEKTRKEKQLGGSERTVTEYSYKPGWHANRIDSSQFKVSVTKEGQSTANPMLPFESKTLTAESVTVGAFSLSPGLIEQINKSTPMSLKAEDAAKVRVGAKRLSPPTLAEQPMTSATAPTTPGKDSSAAIKGGVQPQKQQQPQSSPGAVEKTRRSEPVAAPMPAEATQPSARPARQSGSNSGPALIIQPPQIVEGKYFYYGDDPGNPKIGDIRVSFTVTEPGEVTVLAAQQDNKLLAYTAKNGKTRELLSQGILTKEAIIQEDEAAAGMMVWILRFVGFIVMSIGAYLVVSPIATIADVIPFLGDVVGAGLMLAAVVLSAFLSLATIAVAWLFYRPLYGLALLGIGIAVVVAAKMLFSSSKSHTAKSYPTRHR